MLYKPLPYKPFFDRSDETIEELKSKYIEELKYRCKRLETANEKLEKENKELKDEAYSQTQLSIMKSKYNKMKADLYRGFPIYLEEQEKIDEWKNNHYETKHNATTLAEKLRLGGAIGGKFSYVFIPTSIGTIGKVQCSCGDEFCFRELG